jgi:hypothetical protein
VANWQRAHQENQPIVFRLDLLNGWYRISCIPVERGSPSSPLVVGGNRLVEGCGIVEVTDSHLRIIVRDPDYGGWTWTYRGPWHEGWWRW